MASVISRKFNLPAKLVGATAVTLVDYSSEGLVVEHVRPLHPEELPAFVLQWNGERVSLRCRIASSELRVAGGAGFDAYRSTLAFLDPDPDALETIDRIVERSRIAAAHQDDASEDSPGNADHSDPPSAPAPRPAEPLAGWSFDLWSEA